MRAVDSGFPQAVNDMRYLARVREGALGESTPYEWTRRTWLKGLGASALVGVSASRVAQASALSDADLLRAFTMWRQHSKQPFAIPDAGARGVLLEGKVLKRRLPPRNGAPDGAMALVIVDHSQTDMWLGSADGDHIGSSSAEGDLITYDLPKRGDEMFRWYGLVDLPMPFSDRHFVIRTTVNSAMSRATDRACWERTWVLEKDGVDTMRPIVAAGNVKGLTLKRFESAIYVPANIGGWLAIKLPGEKTLFGYHASSSAGGDIPDKAVNRLVFWGLGRLIADVTGHAARMRSHYVGGHPLIKSGDGGVVPLY